MLVDDSQKEVSLLKEGLQAAGYDVVTAPAAALGLPDRVAALKPDVIIIGTESPTRDVLEHVSVMTARDPRPIVLFTDDGEHATIQAALKAGVSAYVVAGIQADRLQPIHRTRSVPAARGRPATRPSGVGPQHYYPGTFF